ncbi:QRFP-like peptide receptor [Oculina patagonica]
MLNTTMNGTQSLIQSSSCYNPSAVNIGITFAYCLIFVVSLAGNILIGIIVHKTKTMRKPINFLIVNMAMSDLLYPIFLFPQITTKLYVGSSWLISGPLGQTFCKLVPFLQDISLAVSIQSLVLIAVDRFGAVIFPLRSPLISSKLCPFFILATWIVAMATFSPYLFAHKLVEYQGGQMCVAQWNEVFGDSLYFANYRLALFVVGFFIPLVLIAILYITIYLKLKSQTMPGEQPENARQQRLKRERNVLKMATAIVVGFAVCWLPFTIWWILFLFVSSTVSCGLQYFWFVATPMARANCAINPCICFIFSKNYRQSLRNLLRRF